MLFYNYSTLKKIFIITNLKNFLISNFLKYLLHLPFLVDNFKNSFTYKFILMLF